MKTAADAQAKVPFALVSQRRPRNLRLRAPTEWLRLRGPRRRGPFPPGAPLAKPIPMVMRVTDLACGRGEAQVLAGLSFSLASGQALILRGANGSGKTTLLRTLAGLTPPIRGQIEVAPDAIAYSGHADGIKAQQSVAENLTFWTSVFGSRGGITAAMDAFDLQGLAPRRAGELSAGQKRRLSLARLLVTNRPIWCLDEPTVSLDTENTARFAAAVTAHLQAGGAALIATHIDLGLQAETLDVTQFTAHEARPDDPFAADDFAEAAR